MNNNGNTDSTTFVTKQDLMASEGRLGRQFNELMAMIRLKLEERDAIAVAAAQQREAMNNQMTQQYGLLMATVLQQSQEIRREIRSNSEKLDAIKNELEKKADKADVKIVEKKVDEVKEKLETTIRFVQDKHPVTDQPASSDVADKHRSSTSHRTTGRDYRMGHTKP